MITRTGGRELCAGHDEMCAGKVVRCAGEGIRCTGKVILCAGMSILRTGQDIFYAGKGFVSGRKACGQTGGVETCSGSFGTASISANGCGARGGHGYVHLYQTCGIKKAFPNGNAFDYWMNPMAYPIYLQYAPLLVERIGGNVSPTSSGMIFSSVVGDG
jgi:hypothetical protein